MLGSTVTSITHPTLTEIGLVAFGLTIVASTILALLVSLIHGYNHTKLLLLISANVMLAHNVVGIFSAVEFCTTVTAYAQVLLPLIAASFTSWSVFFARSYHGSPRAMKLVFFVAALNDLAANFAYAFLADYRCEASDAGPVGSYRIASNVLLVLAVHVPLACRLSRSSQLLHDVNLGSAITIVIFAAHVVTHYVISNATNHSCIMGFFVNLYVAVTVAYTLKMDVDRSFTLLRENSTKSDSKWADFEEVVLGSDEKPKLARRPSIISIAITTDISRDVEAVAPMATGRYTPTPRAASPEDIRMPRAYSPPPRIPTPEIATIPFIAVHPPYLTTAPLPNPPRMSLSAEVVETRYPVLIRHGVAL